MPESYNLCSSTTLDNHFTRRGLGSGHQSNEHDKFLFGAHAAFEVSCREAP